MEKIYVESSNPDQTTAILAKANEYHAKVFYTNQPNVFEVNCAPAFTRELRQEFDKIKNGK